ncbi:MAG: Wzt carbohydrate-binding domain-containing protein, partial [Lachnospiraceae bacterium]|nr:Wzt carbohydrate-binding domain-containing protein [Lachnospiraceae bacterium]
LIVDEALSVGDVFFQSKCYRKFDEFKKAGKTILFVSHDLGSVAKYCDRVILLDKGKKMAEGKPKEIIDLYKQVLVSNAENRDLDDKGTVLEEEDNDSSNDDVAWKNVLLNNPNVLEYGEKYAEIIDYAILDEKKRITNNIQKNTQFHIRMKVQFHRDVKDPIMAFTIKDLQGTEMTGTNTMYEKVDLGNIKMGEVKIVEFTQNMNLQGRNYLLSLGCVGYENNEFVVYHRLYDVCNINVISDKDTVGFFDMNSKVKVLK